MLGFLKPIFFTRMRDEREDLSDEGYRRVSHGVSVTDVGLDDVLERLLHALK